MSYFVKQYMGTKLLCEGEMSLNQALSIADLEISETCETSKSWTSYEFYLNGKPVYPVYGVYEDVPMFTLRFSNMEGLGQDVDERCAS
jgi:hypothetical protein